MTIYQYLNSENDADKDYFEEYTADNIFGAFASSLPQHPPVDKDAFPIWCNGEVILCATEWLCETIANAIEAIIGEKVMHTGYYDPREDEESGETDWLTGWYYIDFD